MPGGRIRLVTRGRKQRAFRRPMSALKRVKKDVAKLKSNIERKSVGETSPWTAVSTSATEIGLGPKLITQGTGQNDRVGNRITGKSVNVKMQLKIGDGVSNDAYNQIRCIIIKYTTDDPADTPNLSDILETTTASSEELMVSMYKRDSDYRFNVLHDHVYDLYWRNSSGFTAGSGGAPQIRTFSFHKKLNDLSIRYNNSGDPTTELLMFVVSDSGVVTHPEICYSTRFYYTDK